MRSALRSGSVVLLLVLSVLAVPPTELRSAAAVATFEPIASTDLGLGTVLGKVVADGRGTLHSVVRQNLGGGSIVYRRSTDGGVGWSLGARFAGAASNATDPVVAVSGDRVLIGFTASWCESPTVCSRAPHVAWSLDGGLDWSSPVRLSPSAATIEVAVDGDRFWAAWDDYTGHTKLRGWTDDVHAGFAAQTFTGELGGLAAGGDVTVLALGTFSGGSVVVANGTAVGPATPLPAGLRLGAYPASPVAVSPDRAHVLLTEPPDTDPATPQPTLRVWSAPPDGTFAPPVEVMPAGRSAAIAANADAVGVTALGLDGTTAAATSLDGGATFSAPVAIAHDPAAGAYGDYVWLGMSVSPPADGPDARFDWSVPETYKDRDGDTYPDPANRSGDPATDRAEVVTNGTLPVTLNGCASTPDPTSAITFYRWYLDGALVRSGATCAGYSIDLADDQIAEVRLEVDDNAGRTAAVTQEVAPRNLIVASIGDSVASGEGNPHVPGVSPTWQDRACHRSAAAGPARAARRLEAADPHTSVTFLHLACSGAAIVDTATVAGGDPDTGGVLDGYRGIDDDADPVQSSQMAQLAERLGTRNVDAVLVSVGANDARFSDVIKHCLKASSCDDPADAERVAFEARLLTLPQRYALLHAALDGLPVAPEDVLITEYPDLTSDDNGLVTLRCVAGDTPLEVIDDDEALWARDGVGVPLNAQVQQAATTHGWRHVGGIAAGFFGHGYCATDHWIVRIAESILEQGWIDGAFHPSRSGHLLYGERLFASLQDAFRLDLIGGPTGLAPKLGDLMATIVTPRSITSAAARVDGAAPVPKGVHTIDRLIAGEGVLISEGPPAVDRATAVVGWSQLPNIGTTEAVRARLGQVASRVNVGVADVRIVQAPEEGELLVADRPALVVATLEASLTTPTDVRIVTIVESVDPGNTGTVLLETDELVEVKPGRTRVLLPDDPAATVSAPAGTALRVTVRVEDPVGAEPGSDADDELVLDTDRSPAVVTTRPLEVVVALMDGPGSGLTCSQVAAAAKPLVAFATDAMPVSDDFGVDARLSCMPLGILGTTEAEIAAELMRMDALAFWMGVDVLVGVTPAGSLSAPLAGAVGVASPRVRAALVEVTAPPQTLAHELAHTTGVVHVAPGDTAGGVRVRTRAIRRGFDWMAPVAAARPWTSGPVWDLLAKLIGTEPAPAPFELSPGVYVRGQVVREPDGSLTIQPGEWIPALPGALPPDPPPFDEWADELELEMLTVEQVDEAGDPVAEPTPVELRPVGGLGALEIDGALFSTQVALAPGATRLRLVRDGVLVEERAVGAHPVVTVTEPTAAVEVARGAPLTVMWTAIDPDTPAGSLRATVLLSSDGGASWQPFAEGIDGETVTADLPATVGGGAVVARVIVSDGVRFGQADSAPFSAEATDVVLPEERVLFQRRGGDAGGVVPTEGSIWTMRPDGTDVQRVPFPVLSEFSDEDRARNDYADCAILSCLPYYETPSWGPGGTEIAVAARNLFLPAFGGKGFRDADGLGEDRTESHVWVMRADGTGLDRVTHSTYDAAWWNEPVGAYDPLVRNVCPTLSPDGQRIAWYSTRLGLLVSSRGAGTWSPPEVLLDYDTAFAAADLPAGFATPSDTHPIQINPPNGLDPTHCPTWSPDGTSIALIGGLEYRVNVGATYPGQYFVRVALLVAADGSDLDIVTPAPNGWWQYYGSGDAVFRSTSSLWAHSWSGPSTLSVEGELQVGGAGPYVRAIWDRDAGAGTWAPRYQIEPGAPVGLRDGPASGFHTLRYRPAMCSEAMSYSNVRQSGVFTVVDPSDDSVTEIVAEDEPAATLYGEPCTTLTDQIDVAVVTPPTAEPPVPLVELDPAVEPPDDPDDLPEVPVEPTETVLPDPLAPPVPGADDPIPAPPTPADLAIEIVAGEVTPLVLETVEDVAVPFDVRTVPPVAQLAVSVPVAGPSGLVTGIDGTIWLEPAPGFVGTATITYGVVGDADHVGTVLVTVIPATTPPGPPIDVSAIGGAGSAAVQWSAPASDGGLPISGYEVRVRETGSVVAVAGTTTSTSVGGLTNGDDYTFEVRAANAEGFGPYSAASNVARPRATCDASAFGDVPTDHPFCPEIAWMADSGIGNGYLDGTYRPTGRMTRQAMAAFIYRLSGAPLGADPTCSAAPFPDVPANHAFCGEIDWMADEGISSGFADGTYRPDAPVSRQALAAFLYRLTSSPAGEDPACATAPFTDVAADHAFCGEIDWMVDVGLAAGFADGSFRPVAPITRQAMSAFLFRYDVLTGIVAG